MKWLGSGLPTVQELMAISQLRIPSAPGPDERLARFWSTSKLPTMRPGTSSFASHKHVRRSGDRELTCGHGFGIEEVVFICSRMNKLFFVSFWETKKDAEVYQDEWYPRVKVVIEPYFATPPVVTYWKPEDTFCEKLFTKVMV